MPSRDLAETGNIQGRSEAVQTGRISSHDGTTQASKTVKHPEVKASFHNDVQIKVDIK